MDITILNAQLKKYEEGLEQAKATVYRYDGAIQAIKAILEEFDKPEEPKPTDPQ